MNNTTFWIGYVLGFLLAIGAIFIAIKKFQHISAPDIVLEDINLKDLNGNSVSFSEFSDKPLVVNFWATWCGPCVREFPEFEAFRQEFGDKVNFVMVSDETVEKIAKFKQENSYSFNFLQSVRPLKEFGVNIRPTTYFYNSKGNLIKKQIGTIDIQELKNILDGNIE